MTICSIFASLLHAAIVYIDCQGPFDSDNWKENEIIYWQALCQGNPFLFFFEKSKKPAMCQL